MITRYRPPAFKILDKTDLKSPQRCYVDKCKEPAKVCVEVGRKGLGYGVGWTVCDYHEENIIDLVESEAEAEEYHQRESQWKESRLSRR